MPIMLCANQMRQDYYKSVSLLLRKKKEKKTQFEMKTIYSNKLILNVFKFGVLFGVFFFFTLNYLLLIFY